jgi:hypothetical protein
MSGAEGIGEAVTGGLLARAVEPEAGEGQEGGSNCLNCGAELIGNYCHSCGQPGHVHRTLTSFWHDLIHGVLHFEGKTFRTLPLLAWKPGELTRRYIEGERARFVSPMALFLFSVFLMFAVFSALGGPGTPKRSDLTAEDIKEMNAERAEAVGTLKQLLSRREQVLRKGGDVQAIDQSIADARQEVAVLNSIEGKSVATDGGSFLESNGDSLGWFEGAYKKAKENPELLIYKLQNNAYKFSWALIPISVPFVWLLFAFRRRYRAYDHTVFVTYSLAFMTLLAVAASVLTAIGLNNGLVVLALMIVPPIHMYRQLRGAYALGRLSALWRTMALVFFAMIAGTIFFTLLLTIGVLG